MPHRSRSVADTYLLATEGKTVGHRSLKATYFLYTDATFTTRVPQPVWHGLQGPLLAAEAGDILKVVFKNSLPSRTVNLRPIAPLLALAGNGSLEASQGSSVFSPAAEPGQTVTYRCVRLCGSVATVLWCCVSLFGFLLPLLPVAVALWCPWCSRA